MLDTLQMAAAPKFIRAEKFGWLISVLFCRDGTRNTSTSRAFLRALHGRGGLEAAPAESVEVAVRRGLASGWFPPPVPSEERKDCPGCPAVYFIL
jgi:hypothetical protein